LTPELATKFQVVPSAGPAQRIFELPDVVVEARGALLSTQVRERGVRKAEKQQSVETCRVAVTDSEAMSEIPNARIPACSAAKRDMTPANAEIVDQIAAEHSRPVTNRVVDGSRGVGVPQQHLRVGPGVILVSPGEAIVNAVLIRSPEVYLKIPLVHF